MRALRDIGCTQCLKYLTNVVFARPLEQFRSNTLLGIDSAADVSRCFFNILSFGNRPAYDDNIRPSLGS